MSSAGTSPATKWCYLAAIAAANSASAPSYYDAFMEAAICEQHYELAILSLTPPPVAVYSTFDGAPPS